MEFSYLCKREVKCKLAWFSLTRGFVPFNAYRADSEDYIALCDFADNLQYHIPDSLSESKFCNLPNFFG